MSQRIPIYKVQEETFQADSCRPLQSAAQQGQITLEAVTHGHYPGRHLPRNVLPGLKSVGFWDAHQQQDWGLDWHQNEGLEICLLERGQLAFAVDGQSFQLEPNDLTITRPWQTHRLGNPTIGPGRLHWVIIDLGVRRPHQNWGWPKWIVLTRQDLDELTNLMRHNEHPVWHQANEVSQCFQRIASIVEQQNSEEIVDVSWLKLLINELLLHVLTLLRSYDIEKDTSLTETQRTVQLFLDDLRADPRYLAEEWTLKLMAEACGLGVTRFTEYCRRLTNTTPMQHLNQLRLEAAVELLSKQPNLSNVKVAETCGFNSPQYFATVFRRHYGCSPQCYPAGSAK